MGDVEERAIVRRLHDRLGLGATRADVDLGAAVGIDATVDQLLATDEAPPSTLPDLPPLSAIKDDDDLKTDVEAQRRDQQRTLTLWWLDRMATVTAPRAEKLAWLWHGHFATSSEKVRDPGLMFAQNQTFRTAGQDSFAALTKKMVIDPALNQWLDNQTNRKGLPNENLGRELMELFTLGVGRYSEGDVRESARALTGWTLRDRELIFARNKFDDGPKTVLGSSAAYNAEDLAHLLTAHPDSARFIATRLWARLVSTTPPTDADLERLTAAYGRGTSIRDLLRALVTAPAFRDSNATLVKQPVEWAVGLARSVGRPISSVENKDSDKALNQLKALGQVPFKPPNVGGWPAGAPYLTPAATAARLRLATALLQAGTLAVETPPSGPNARLEWARASLAVDTWSARTRAALTPLTEGDPRRLLIVAAVSPEYVVSG